MLAEGSPGEPEAKPEAGPEAGAEGQPEAEPEAGAEGQPEAEPEAEPHKPSDAEQLEIDTAFCTLIGGVIPKTYPSPVCSGQPETKEDCTAKEGKWGELCLDESICVPTNDETCFFLIPKELITPAVAQSLQGHFDFFTAKANTESKPGDETTPKAETAPARRQRRRMRRMRRMRRRM